MVSNWTVSPLISFFFLTINSQLLPLLTKSKSVRSRRPIAIQTEEPEESQPILDQIALADTWKSPNKVISATYAGNPQTGN